ncbi:MAG: major facilitator transporter [uncultured bacterium]|nr:MAG: major facilitator transporter [uncultured bacterium]
MLNTKPKQNYIVLVLFMVIFIDTMGIGFAWPIFGSLFTGKTTNLFTSAVSMQWRNILYGITMGIASLFMFLGAPILGNISDQIGRRKVMLFCLFGTSLGMGISALGVIFNQVALLMLSRAWLGAIAASQIIAQATIIDISTQKNKASLLGVVAAANNLGFIVGPIIGSLLIDKTLVSWFNFTTPFYFAAILAFLSALLLLLTYKETLKNQITKTLQFPRGFKIFVRAFAHKKIRTVAFIYICFQVGWAMYFQTVFLSLIQKYNYSGRLLGYFYLWMGVIFCLNLLLIVRIVTRFVPFKKIIYIALSTSAICCVAAIYSGEMGLWLGMLPMASAIALGGNALVTTFSNVAEENEQGWVLGISSSLTALSWAITPPVAGLLLALGFHVPLSIAGVLFLLGTIIAILKLKNNLAVPC